MTSKVIPLIKQETNKQTKTRPNQKTKNTLWILLIQMAERMPQVRTLAWTQRISCSGWIPVGAISLIDD